MKIANKPLNSQAIAIEEAEARIRLIVKERYLSRTPKPKIDHEIRLLIKQALKEIELPVLKRAAARSLINFYARQYLEISALNGARLTEFLLLRDLTSPNTTPSEKANARFELVRRGYDSVNLYGNAAQKYAKDYIEKNVRPVLDRLAEQYPYDPDDVTEREYRNSLRNRAEMEVRYDAHEQQIADLKKQGNKLVIASMHADCSERCRPWQGRVYSLDGTTGVTEDGRRYVPLENARDIIYTTKAGKQYKNGLLGFNCRHYLVAYQKGFEFPKPNPIEEQKQYMITLTQRQLERNVRKWRTEALTCKDADRERYLKARQKAIEWNRKYIEYSQKNDRAYYPSRTKLI